MVEAAAMTFLVSMGAVLGAAIPVVASRDEKGHLVATIVTICAFCGAFLASGAILLIQ